MKTKNEYKTIKIWNKTLKDLKILAGLKNLSMVKLLHSLVHNELKIEMEKYQQKETIGAENGC